MRVRIASAGTGKTTQLVRDYLAALDDHPPHRMAAVTFTRAAAAELDTRLRQALVEAGRPELASAVFATTIHGFFAELVRLFAPWLGVDPDFLRVEAPEAELLFQEVAASWLYVTDREAWLSPLLTLFKKRSLAPELAPAGPAAEELFGAFSEVLSRYRESYGRRLLGPTEIELLAHKLIGLLRRDRALRDRLLRRFRRVFVDEYQDTSPLQGEVFEALAGLGVELDLVGDPKQSIYAFRNADVEVFRRALARGKRLSPLVKTYRHPPKLAAFLNRLTGELSRREFGFRPEEAPPVEAAREGPATVGFLRLAGDELDRLRLREARWLAHRLKKLAEEGVSYSEMAVLVRSYGSVRFLERAFRSYGIPYVVLGGRGLFSRPEVLDLYYALKALTDPSDRLALAAFLHGAFVGLELSEAVAIATAEDPRARLAEARPEVARYLERWRARVRELSPVELLEALVREPGPDGESVLSRLSPEERANVDAVLFKLAGTPFERYPLLIEAFERLARVEDEGTYAEGGGEAVRISTIHKAKGLEWRVVWVYDLNRGGAGGAEVLYVRPGSGEFALREDPTYGEFKAAWDRREKDEAYRLLYVALSRARERLFFSYSRGKKAPAFGNPAHALETAAAWEWEELGFAERRGDPPREPGKKPARRREKSRAPELAGGVPRGKLAAVVSPSGLLKERRPPPDPEGPVEPSALAGRLVSTAVGVLVHFAVAMNWRPEPERLRRLWAQEVMHRLAEPEREEVKRETEALLQNYWAMLGQALPALEARSEDRAELPFALPWGASVIEGVIDRLYRVGETWYLEDYKTDRVEGDLKAHVEEAGYAFQLAVYARAVREALGIRPRVRLVFLRRREVLELEEETLEAALNRPDLLPSV